MKKLFISFMIIIAFSPLCFADEKLIICYDSWPPSTIFPLKNHQKRGFVIDILSHIYSSRGYEIEFRECPYARCLSDCSAGKCDLMAEAVPNLEDIDDFYKIDLLFPKNKTFAYKYVFFVNSESNWTYDGTSSLKEMLIADIVGYDYSSLDRNYEDYLNNKENKKNIFRASGTNAIENILIRISENRVDLFSESEIVGKYYLKKLNLEDRVKIAGGFENKLILKPAFSPLSPKSEKLMEIWDNEIESIKKNKAHLKFVDKYLDVKDLQEFE